MSEPGTWPIDETGVAALRKVIADIDKVGDAIGGWTEKSDCRQTGFSLHLRFQNTVDVTTTLAFVNILSQSPAMLRDACARLVAAHEMQP